MEIEQLKTQVQSSINNELFKLQLNGSIELEKHPKTRWQIKIPAQGMQSVIPASTHLDADSS